MASLPPSDPALIEVRHDEQLDLTHLEPWLRTHLPHTEGPLSVRQFGGGRANLTYLIRFGAHEYVLRRPPLGPIAPTSHDMQREHRVLKQLGTAFPLAPTSFALCGDPAVLGVDFHVMERRHGIVIRGELPTIVQQDPAIARRLGEMIIDALADLHRVSPETVGLGTLGHPDGFVTRQLSGWTKRWHAAKDRDLVSVDRVGAWLHAHLPATHATTLLHNDYKLDNILVEVDDPATAVAVLDWDMCTRGDPLMDLGYLLNTWVEAADDPTWSGLAGMSSHAPGFPTRQAAVERYARRTGFDVSQAQWYHIFGIFKLIVILQQIYIRFLRNQTQDRRFMTLGRQVEGLAEKGVTLLAPRD